MKRKSLKFVQFWLVMTCCLWSLSVVALADSEDAAGCLPAVSTLRSSNAKMGSFTIESIVMHPDEVATIELSVYQSVPSDFVFSGGARFTFDPTLISIVDVRRSSGSTVTPTIDNDNGTLSFGVGAGLGSSSAKYTLVITSSVTQTPADGIETLISGDGSGSMYCPGGYDFYDISFPMITGTVTILDTLPTPLPTATFTPSPTPAPTDPPSPTPSPTATSTATPIPTPTNTATPTAVPTATPQSTGCTAPQWVAGGIYETGDIVSNNGHEWEAQWYSNIPTDEPGTTGEWGVWLDLGACDGTTVSSTPTNTAVPTATDTPMPTSTNTPTPPSTSTSTPIPTSTPTATATNTPLPTSTSTSLPISTSTPLPTATDTPTSTPIPTDASTATMTNTPLPASTSTPVPTSTSTPIPTSTDTQIPTPTNTATPNSISGTTGDAVPLGVMIAEMSGSTASSFFICVILLILTCGYVVIARRRTM